MRDDDPASGFAVTVSQTRFSQQYWATRNRLGVLVETHSWKAYPTRVRVTRNAIVAVMELAADGGAAWRAAAQHADVRATQIGGSTVPLTFVNTDHVTTIDFRSSGAFTHSSSTSNAGTAAPRSSMTCPETRCPADSSS